MKRLPGRWVEFLEPNDLGEIPEGFYIDEERAKTFKREPGFLRNQLRYVYLGGFAPSHLTDSI